jgi:transcriptional regulator GlxA family with amidase domain
MRRKRGDPVDIGILTYPGTQLAAIHGLTDLFNSADALARARAGDDGPLLRVAHLSVDERTGTVRRTDGGASRRAGEPAVLILPPCLGQTPTRDGHERLIGYLQARHAGGTLIASVCVGAFLLAEAGLLSGRRATTHWSCTAELAARFPAVIVDGDRLLIEDADIITAGGLMAWVDLGLTLVRRLLGAAVMHETARYLLVDPPGREQRNYSRFAPRLDHGDAAILKVQRWLAGDAGADAAVAAMAERAGLEERTFLRRFRRATGLAPKDYSQQLRIARAREMLETGRTGIAEIAWTVGYADPAAFRKVFLRVTGLGPGEYRRRFGVQAFAGSSRPAISA